MTDKQRQLGTPSLRMTNGGNFLTRLIAGSPTGRTLAGRREAVDQVAAPPVPAPAPPPPPPVREIRFRDGGSLRTGIGGEVPGRGKGDKVDAKYEPGEFVVSNDMLGMAPGLREQLHSLRGEALAAKGMTPEEADAKAIAPGGLRATRGFGIDPYVNHRAPNGPPISPPAPQLGYTPTAPSTAVATTPYRPNFVYGDGVLKQPPPASPPAASPPAPPSPDFGNEAQARARAAAKARATAPPAKAPDAPAPSPATGKLRGAANAAKGLAKGAALGAAGYGAARLVDGVGEGADGTNPETRANVLSIPTTTNEEVGRTVVGETPEYSFWQNTDLGRNVSNTLNALTPFTMGATTALRAGSTAAKALNLAKPTALGVQQGANAIADEGRNAALRTPPAAAAKAPATPAATVAAGAAPRAEITRTGNSYTGPADITGEISINGRSATAGGAVDSGLAARKAERDALTLRDMARVSESRAEREAGAAATQAGNDRSLEVARGIEARMDGEKRRRNADVRLGSISATRDQRKAALAELAALDAADLQGGKNEADAKRSAASDAVSLRNNQVNADVEAGKFAASAASSSASAQRAQANDDRKYQLDVARLGIEAANKNRDDKRAGEESFAKRVASMIGDDEDGTKAARVVNSANMFLGDAIRAAEAELRSNPGNAKAARDLERLQGGIGALDDKKISELMLSTQASEALEEYDGIMPWSGESQNSGAPIKSLSLRKGLVFDDYISDDASGNQVLPARALKGRPDLNRLVVK